jgi:hypothetical protein
MRATLSALMAAVYGAGLLNIAGFGEGGRPCSEKGPQRRGPYAHGTFVSSSTTESRTSSEFHSPSARRLSGRQFTYAS